MSAKPKILCLHGYAENGELFHIKTRNFRRVVGDNAELVYPTAPIDVGILRATAEELLSPDGGNDFRNFSWWWTKSAQRVEVRGLDKSLKAIAQILNEQGPFDGILGFSQGACFASMICALLEGREGFDFGVPVDHPPFKFAVLSGAVIMELGEMTKLFDTQFTTPSMHMMGTLDTVIDIKGSKYLAAKFDNPVIYEFVGGHFLPNTPHARRAMRAFLKDFIPVDEEPESS